MTETTAGTALAAGSRLHGPDHLRAFAITFVLLYHYGGLFPHPAWVHTVGEFGWTGVDLFFVLSGYLIASQLFAEISRTNRLSLRTFFIKRGFRIIPAYLFVVAIYFCLPFAREREAPAPLWKYLTFTQNIGLDLRTQGTFSHAWSLCIEEQFYLILPFVLLLLMYFRVFAKGRSILLMLFLSGFIIRYYSYQAFVVPHLEEDGVYSYWYKAIYYPTWCRLDGLITGIGIAGMCRFMPSFTRRLTTYGNGLFALSICLLTGAYFLCAGQESMQASVVGFPLVSTGYGLMLLAAISPSCFLYKASTVTRTIATLSYALYLVHKIIIHLTQAQLDTLSVAQNSNLMFLICLSLCLLAAMLVNRLVEKPFLALRNRIVKKAVSR